MNDFSQRFAKALSESGDVRLHEIAALGRSINNAFRYDGHCPGGHPVCITTESGDEVTIHMGEHWHVHVDEFEYPSEHEGAFEAAIALLQKLMDGSVVVAEWYDAGRYVGSGLVDPARAAWEAQGERSILLWWSGQ